MVYAYINNIYSSRKIEEVLQENVYYMWLSGMSKPDHNTINRFRGKRLQSIRIGYGYALLLIRP
jgi:transposase